MSARSFSVDAEVASATARPVPRGIAIRVRSDGDASLPDHELPERLVGTLDSWDVSPFEGLPGWFEATPPQQTADAEPLPLGTFWEHVRAVRELPGVQDAEPLFLVANPDADATAGFAQDQFGLWGWPYDGSTMERIERVSADSDWHLDQLRVDAALTRWREQHPNLAPGEGVIVAHPDTGFTDHPEMRNHWEGRGRSFLAPEGQIVDAFDDLDSDPLAAPGHGTATASLIASGIHESNGTRKEIYGIAPGAKILPLRVSRSVIHFDFSNVAHAIGYAIEQDADVISMSLGGPVKSDFLRACIREAQAHGMIVVSAAGNKLPTVVFPAAFPEVLAVAATHAAKEPWRYSGLGATVDIAAPGEDVWRARSALADSGPEFTSAQGTGTSYATACVAGIAALWLSYHGGRRTIADALGGDLSAVPVAFQYLLASTADTSPDFVRRGRHGSGIANAEALLEHPLPAGEEIDRFRRVLDAQSAGAIVTLTGLFTGWLGVTEDLSTYRPSIQLAVEATVRNGKVRKDSIEKTDAVARVAREAERETAFLKRFLGEDVDDLREELLARIAADPHLLAGSQMWRPGESLVPLFARLIGATDDDSIASPRLQQALRQQLTAERERERPLYQGKLDSPVTALRYSEPPSTGPAAPAFRMLRAYAFDPSQETMLNTVPISQVTVPVRWESLQPGPVGEYIEVVDVDPASSCIYAPVDLSHPHIIAQDGLAPSEGNPQFHQQMVYAVAMAAVNRFELALGRPIFWSAIRPWLQEQTEERWYFTPDTKGKGGGRDRYVQRLRIYPHGLREANAHYSPPKRSLLFGYFPGSDDDSGKHYPGGMVFTCLSHDIIVHETTHALVDGIHPYFNEPGAGDMWAFHEAFADIIALFQHFTYPEVLRHQIARTRGDLETNNLLGQLAQQFGQAASGRQALRDALGSVNQQGVWERRRPDPRALLAIREPHDRGSILVAAVFDAFLALYNDRIADLLRLYTGGTGIIPAGQIHPDLVNRLAVTAAETAEEILNTCIRSMDYLPPVDIVFGEFLRALITADYDLSPAARRRIRIAFIEAFRSWGIYPRDVTTLSEETLLWQGPSIDSPLQNLRDANQTAFSRRESTLRSLQSQLEVWEPGKSRSALFEGILDAQASIHGLLTEIQQSMPQKPLVPGIDLRKGASFSVSNLRLARKTGAHGAFRNEMIFEVVQSHRLKGVTRSTALPPRGGATLVVDLSTWDIRYVIYKRLYASLPDAAGDGTGKLAIRLVRRQSERDRLAAARPQSEWKGEATEEPLQRLAQTYGSLDPDSDDAAIAIRDEPFRFLHHTYIATGDRAGGSKR